MKTCYAALVAVVVITGSRPAAANVELEAQLLGGTGSPLYGGTGAGGLIGIPLGTHTVLMTGLAFSGGASDQMEGWAICVPLTLKLYLRAPAERKLVPVLRVGGAYSRSSAKYTPGGGGVGLGVLGPMSEFTAHTLQFGGSAGVTYFITSNVGLGLDAGMFYSRQIENDSSIPFSSESWSIDARWGASLTFRL